jgi:transposase
LIAGPQPGDVLVMDDRSNHKAAGVREAAGATLLHLPPYSPDPDPIELASGKPKRLLRSAAQRTTEGLWNTLGPLFDRFTHDGCGRHFDHCGRGRSTWNGSANGRNSRCGSASAGPTDGDGVTARRSACLLAADRTPPVAQVSAAQRRSWMGRRDSSELR